MMPELLEDGPGHFDVVVKGAFLATYLPVRTM